MSTSKRPSLAWGFIREFNAQIDRLRVVDIQQPDAIESSVDHIPQRAYLHAVVAQLRGSEYWRDLSRRLNERIGSGSSKKTRRQKLEVFIHAH
ncbi:hypothetical protein YTPLAS72_21360 [Nitrospira sp.]|nr:hypothetical protein YTPLAS72_21360 [Nitrospira sp.]